MRMEVISATLGQPRAEECAATWGCEVTWVRDLPLLEAYQRGYEQSRADILAYLHDDLVCREPDWQARVLAEFDDPKVGVVGFGGATVHGDPELYRVPYKLQHLGRSGYLSNTDDAEVHGERFEGATDCAVIDGFACVVRRSVLNAVGGWPIKTPVGYSNYDYWACAMAHRLGYRLRVVGIRCHHLGGLTAIGMKKAEGTGQAHVDAHRYIYDNFADVLPYRCER